MPGHFPSVYDFSSLRIHPDGTRVRQSSSRNLNPRHGTNVVRDSRGNWFARDAAGPSSVAKYKWVDDGDGQQFNSRPVKRQKFMEDFRFLTSPESSTSTSGFLLPSSDLLKNIHYFASHYYHDRGQLLNASREYRKQRKKNKAERLEMKRRADNGEAIVVPHVRRGGRIKGIRGKVKYPKDMYKILDGSVLLAMGMLMQEFVGSMLQVQIPEGWENTMKQAYSETGDEDDDIESETSDEDEGLDSDCPDTNCGGDEGS